MSYEDFFIWQLPLTYMFSPFCPQANLYETMKPSIYYSSWGCGILDIFSELCSLSDLWVSLLGCPLLLRLAIFLTVFRYESCFSYFTRITTRCEELLKHFESLTCEPHNYSFFPNLKSLELSSYTLNLCYRNSCV